MSGTGFFLFGLLSVLAAGALIFVVVIQNSKGGGLSGSFGGSGATQMLGSRRSNEFIEKLTWYLAAFLVVVSILANWAGTAGKDGINTDLEMRSALDAGAFEKSGVSNLPTFENPSEEGTPPEEN